MWRRKHLSPAEQRVVELIATGLSTKEAAARLDCSYFTARNQLEHAMRKLGVRTRYELICALRPVAPAPAQPARAGEGIESLEYAI